MSPTKPAAGIPKLSARKEKPVLTGSLNTLGPGVSLQPKRLLLMLLRKTMRDSGLVGWATIHCARSDSEGKRERETSSAYAV